MAVPVQKPQIESAEASTPIACAENIALFHFLHAVRGKNGAISKDSVPVRPSVDPIEGVSICRNEYSLSFERERSLASALAFLSRIRDDPEHIPAICIEEDHCPGAEASLRILLAVNRATCKDGDGMLQEIKKGFEGLFAVLSQSADSNDNQSDFENEVRRLIVSMCSKTILSRLRFTTRKGKTPKQPAKAALQNVIRALGRRGNMKLSKLTTMSVEETALFIERAKDIIRLIDYWTNHPRIENLEDLVDGFFRLRQVDCQAVLDTIASDKMETNARKSVLNMIQKVARYQEAARFLVRTSRKVPIARRMHIVPISLPENVFVRTVLNSNYKLGLAELLSRIRRSKDTNQIIEQASRADILCRLLKTNPNKAEDELTAQTSRTLKTGKIHAEVQLVFYCELLDRTQGLNKLLLPPRVVCSSKKACFLCNMFIIMHGKIRTPWSHGKLYPGWRLPKCSELDLQSRFNQILEVRIRESIAMLLVRREKTCYPGPSESTLVTLPSLALQSEIMVNPNCERETLWDVTQTQAMEDVNENENEEVMEDNGALLMSSKPLPAAVNRSRITAKLPDDIIQHVKGGITLTPSIDKDSEVKELQQAPNLAPEDEGSTPNTGSIQGLSDLPFRSEMMAKRGSRFTNGVLRDKPSFDELVKEAEPAQSTASSKDDINRSNKDYNIARGQNLCNISKDNIKSPDMREPSPHSLINCNGSVDSLDEDNDLIQGQKLSYTIRAEHRSPFYIAGPLKVQVEYSTGSSLKPTAANQVRELAFSIERLTIGEVARLKAHGGVPICDAEAMIGEVSPALNSLGHLYIAAGKVPPMTLTSAIDVIRLEKSAQILCPGRFGLGFNSIALAPRSQYPVWLLGCPIRRARDLEGPGRAEAMLCVGWGPDGEERTTDIDTVRCFRCGCDSLSDIDQPSKTVKKLVRRNHLTSTIIQTSPYWPVLVFGDGEMDLMRTNQLVTDLQKLAATMLLHSVLRPLDTEAGVVYGSYTVYCGLVTAFDLQEKQARIEGLNSIHRHASDRVEHVVISVVRFDLVCADTQYISAINGTSSPFTRSPWPSKSSPTFHGRRGDLTRSFQRRRGRGSSPPSHSDCSGDGDGEYGNAAGQYRLQAVPGLSLEY
ncbi:hypothetical protein J7T55_000240 [Diaporthe amygdali]|uniref:uncharacterized protein n=1 Tax=Phomopsis amygdali TaxID=1214568 RepID=UPI0022FEFE7E|nr:uncharacterized protein J7T55_000240 [Diaporthe amygdali]KAJ0103731.1 hypothetical protein J7T55_000240 [Diaporthe amygdali]